MKRSALTRDAVVLVPFVMLMLGIIGVNGQQVAPAPGDGAEVQEDVEVLGRGPLHEAFAEQVNHDPQAGIVVPQAPPTPIAEEPPEYKPEEDGVIWIPGYWGWDDEREDFIWISGVWRNPPRGQRWVPGYWHDIDSGFQWVSGFWKTAVQRQVEYLDQPPASLERGPSTAAPTANHFWVPGCWVNRSSWVWRPGYWRRFRANSTWIPDHYAWTPRGVVFLGGYWDHRFSLRGQVYAPVYVPRVVLARPRFVYRPYCVVDLDSIGLHMFVRPRYGHYYFGDFHDPLYRDRHIYSSLYFHTRLFGYDPILSYNQCHYSRYGINYFNHLHHWHSYFGLHPHHRPGRTFGAQLSFAAGGYGSFLNVSVFVHSVHDVIRSGHGHHQALVSVGSNYRKDLVEGSSRVRELARQRQLTEREVRPGVNPAGTTINKLAGTKGSSWKLPENRPVPGQRTVPGTSPPVRPEKADVLSLPPGAKTSKLVVSDPSSGKPSISPLAVPATIRQRPTLVPTRPGGVAGTSPDRPTRPGTKSSATNLPRPPARTTVNSNSRTLPPSPGARPSSSSIRTRPSAPSPGVRPSSSSIRTRPSAPSPGARPSSSSIRTRPSAPSPGARPSSSSIRPSSPSTSPGARPSSNSIRTRPSAPSPGARPSGSSIRPSSPSTSPGARPSSSSIRSRPSVPSPGARPSGSSIRPSSPSTSPGARPSSSSIRSRPSVPSPGARPSGSSIRPSSPSTSPGARPSSSSIRSRPSAPSPGARPSSSSIRTRPSAPSPGARPSSSSIRPSSPSTSPGARPSSSSIRTRPSAPSPGARPSSSSIRPSSPSTSPGARP